MGAGSQSSPGFSQNTKCCEQCGRCKVVVYASHPDPDPPDLGQLQHKSLDNNILHGRLVILQYVKRLVFVQG
jgi:MinD superfamily P-loop ATPase